MAPAAYDGGSEDSSDDDDFNFESAVGSRKFPVHDCCEFEDAESLKRLIFVRQDDSDDASSSTSSSTSSEENDDDSATSSEDEHKSISKALHSNAIGGAAPGVQANISGDKIEPNENAENNINHNSRVNDGPIGDSAKAASDLVDNVLVSSREISNIDHILSIDTNEPKREPIALQRDKDDSVNIDGASTITAPQIEQVASTPNKSLDAAVSEKGDVKDKTESDKAMGTMDINMKDITSETDGGKTEKAKVGAISEVTPPEPSLQSCNGSKVNVKDEESLVQNRKAENPIHAPLLKNANVELPSTSFSDTQLGNTSASTDNGKDHSVPEPKRKKIKKKKPKEATYYCPYDLDQRDNDENTPLHIAIHFRKLECVRLLLEAGADVHKKSDGSAPVHLAVSIGGIPEHMDFAEKCLSLLASYNADFSMKDDSLHTPLYLACMSNAPRCAQIILSDPNGLSTLNVRADRIGGRALHACAKYCLSPRRVGLGASHAHRHPRHQHHVQGGADHALMTKVILECPGIEVDPVNNYGQTPLHVAASRGNWATARLLLRHGANALALDRRGFTPGRLAVKRGIAIPNDLEAHLNSLEGDDATPTQTGISTNDQKRDLIIDPDASTIILCHDLCSLHRSCPPIRRSSASADPPPENVRRLHVLVSPDEGILRCGEFQSCAWEIEARRAAIADVLRVHEYSYIERISQLCASIPDHPSAVSSLDPDTAVSRWSFEAALRAAGSVCEAVDKIMVGDHRNAFCAVRPPGHHAGPRGIVTCPNDPEGSHGFCLLNNVAIGAAYARTMYRNDGIRKVAIIDFDVHHGNGTEEIVRQLIPNIQSSSIRTPYAVGSLHTSRYKPWLDEEDINDVFFASTHGYGPRELCFSTQPQSQGGWFYPASGKTHIADAIRDPSSIERHSLSDFISTQTWARMGDDSRSNCCKIIDIGLSLPHPYAVPGMQRIDLRDAYRKKVLPYLLEFDPDMIFISAGFDAHKKDSMNFGYVGMIEDDYEWVTEQLIKVANACCQGRIVSVLEGGYKIHGGIVSPFARSVASHVRALVEGGSSREMYNVDDGVWESQFERQMVEEKERRRQHRSDKLKLAEMEKRRMRHASTSNFHSLTKGSHDEMNSNLAADNTQHDIDAIMKEPLRDVEATSSTVIAEGVRALTSPLHIDSSSEQHSNNLEESLPSRKRRRNPVDYRELYEQMKKEGNLA